MTISNRELIKRDSLVVTPVRPLEKIKRVASTNREAIKPYARFLKKTLQEIREIDSSKILSQIYS